MSEAERHFIFWFILAVIVVWLIAMMFVSVGWRGVIAVACIALAVASFVLFMFWLLLGNDFIQQML